MGKTTAILAAGAVVAAGAVAFMMEDDYTVDLVMPAATNLVEGSPVQIKGQQVGVVEQLATRDGKAIVTVTVDDEHAPLHDGTDARISWKATLGERIVDLVPGKSDNPELREGALIQSTSDRVELDQVLAALDAPTRTRLQSLLARLDSSLSGNEQDMQQTLSSAGPTVDALGQVLKAVGQDGPAIRQLVTRLKELTSAAAAHDTEISSSIDDLAGAVGTVAERREQLRTLLRELPGTIDTANRTLGRVPQAVDAALPLLADLEPAAARLPGVARQLNPVLRDLRPVTAELRPTLASLDRMLVNTPALLSALESVAPQLGTAGKDLVPVLAHLRPYTPEIAGWLANWGSNSAGYDVNGHYLRAFIQEGGTSLNQNPGIMPPGVTKRHARLPGEAEGQPWTDAFGSELR